MWKEGGQVRSNIVTCYQIFFQSSVASCEIVVVNLLFLFLDAVQEILGSKIVTGRQA